MSIVKPMRSTSMHRRMCVRCGYDGRGVHEGLFRHSDPWCPNCGCDFNRRPPLSYAEMEGLVYRPFVSTHRLTPRRPRSPRARREFLRRVERCLAAMFILLVSVVVLGQLVYLGFSAMR